MRLNIHLDTARDQLIHVKQVIDEIAQALTISLSNDQ